MTWYPLPQSGGGTPSVVDEFLDDHSAGWLLWSFGSADGDHHDNNNGAADVRADKEQRGNERHADERRPVPPQCTQPTDDIFMSQFSAEEVRKMDGPFEALDMFPDSMHRLLSYENMLSGVLTGGAEEDEQQQQQDASTLDLGVDTMDTCGFPLFSHDLQNAPPGVVVLGEDLLLTPPKDHQDGARFVTKRSRSVADEGSLFLEALVLQELEDVVFQLTKRTRVCFRDAFFRLAESSRATKCSSAAADGTTPSSETETETGVHQAEEGNASSRISTSGCPERETNAIDRTVAVLTMKPPRPIPLDVRCADDDSGAAEALSATSWTTTA